MPRRPDTKERIERAALMLFVDAGIDKARTKQIAEEVGISEATIYRHFESKDALAEALFRRQHVQLASMIQGSAEKQSSIAGKVDAIVSSYCAAADDDWISFRFHQLNQGRFLAQFQDDLLNPVDVVVEIIRSAAERGEIPVGNANLQAAMALGIVLQAVTFKAFGRLEGLLSVYAEDFAHAILAVLHVAIPAKGK